ncbi:hypothetical protein QJS10_CPA01g00878 [Acorus calamus]|uniref:Tyrosinase copper-binding domain-containing protein n=1 Tax=Acorus calamus TaxID=4465 RepID=A0AAV9FM47_ACOCL|nr:hypothetical protein QJS10_CPA01g00878 [Acorus calamus]
MANPTTLFNQTPSLIIPSTQTPTTLLHHPHLPLSVPRRHHRHPLTCKATHDNNNHHHQPHHPTLLDRRDILLGLAGVSSASALITPSTPALASPIQAPDLTKCGPADLPTGAIPTNCCPPVKSSDILDFQLPSPSTPLRLRPAAHLVDKAYVEKYAKAISLMKALPADDPRNFTNQANVHCAYCDGAYDQVGFPNLELQVHNSWLFFPWHRCYLYFYERILGKLIGDDTFAIPFWNWDAPAGMTLPSIYTGTSSSLYDKLRDAKHQPPTLVDLDFNGEDPNYTDKEQLDHNLRVMYRQVISNGKTASLFMGLPFRAGDQPNPGAGSLENLPHGPVHVWTGDRTQPNGEDMGTFYSAARDPIFFAHHGNVDRMWWLWRKLSPRHKDFTDKDWLDAAFLFYDEEARPVRVRVRDVLEVDRLRYSYQEVDVPWAKTKPTVRLGPNSVLKTKSRGIAPPPPVVTSFPIDLNKTVSVIVKRATRARSTAQKEEEEEVLVVEGIEFSRDEFVKIDVYVNSAGQEDSVSPGGRELAGSFVNVPHKHKHSKKEKLVTTKLRVGITDLLEDIGAEEDESILVSLVPRKGKSKVKIGGVKIEFAQ